MALTGRQDVDRRSPHWRVDRPPATCASIQRSAQPASGSTAGSAEHLAKANCRVGRAALRPSVADPDTFLPDPDDDPRGR
jgi:hypothetical protein